MRDDTENLMIDVTFKFAPGIIEYCEKLESERKFVSARKLLTSGTSIGANSREAQHAESKAFVHQFKIAAKQVDETKYWLMLCKHSKNYPDPDVLIGNVRVISRITSKSSIIP